MKATSRAILTAGLGVALSMSFAPAALATASNLDVGSATLQAKGLVVSAPVTFVCGAGEQYSISLNLRQIVQKTVTTSDSSAYGDCTGEAQSVTLQGLPSPKPFKKGTAVASLNLDSYCFIPEYGFYDYCGSTSVSKVIRVR